VGDDGVIYYPGHKDGAGAGATAFNPSGTKRWGTPDGQDGPGRISGVALSWDGGTLYRAFAGEVEALDTSTGATRWRRAIAAKNVVFGGSPLLSANGILYWMGGDDFIYAACADDGSLLWKHHLESGTELWGPQSPALAADGTLYVFSSGTPVASGNLPGRLYAFGGPPVTTGAAGAGGGSDGGAGAGGGAATGSCMQLLRCCNEATGTNKTDCLMVYDEAVLEGGSACAAAYQALGEDFCPSP
jgi:outer membrane protein assembly factor BamB